MPATSFCLFQRVRFVMRNSPSTIRERIDDFRTAISNVTESIVNVDAFETHDNDRTKTDVLLHFVDPRDNSVMDVREILKIIDYRTEQLDPLFREFNVLHTVRTVQALYPGVNFIKIGS